MELSGAPSMAIEPVSPRGALALRLAGWIEALDRQLEAERDQLPLWLTVAFGAGIAAWLALPGPLHWAAFLCLASASALLGWLFRQRRSGRALAWAGVAMTGGCALIWARAELVAAERLDRPTVAEFSGRIVQVEHLAARGTERLTLLVEQPGLPPKLRVSVPTKLAPPGLASGALVRLRARLTSPPPMALPGGHDFARDYWFRGIGAAGRAIGPATILQPARGGGLEALRAAINRRIGAALGGSPGAIAIALATGDQGGLAEADAEAMRRSGLTHLLSVSGLHIAAVVGAAMLLTLKLLALSERLALRFNLVLVAGGAGALAGIFYTLLTGAQVPTVRSCIAAVLVIIGLALGREAFSLRLIAVGALVVLAFRPEALAGASFQFSFAAVTAIVVLHQQRWVRRLLQRREEPIAARFGRALAGLVLTGLAVELALIPLALYHFHRAGVYSVAANIVGIPLTTFVIMPLELLALLFSPLGLGAPLWAACRLAIELLLAIAHQVSSASGAVLMLAAMPAAAFAAIVTGGLWLVLWNRRWRFAGLAPLAAGAAAAALTPPPDLLVTGDGRHVALIAPDGTPALLRSRSGDFIRGLVGEAAGSEREALRIEALAGTRCSRDSCFATIERGGRQWRLLAMRSNHFPDWLDLVRACAAADIVIADRRLPSGCVPRWLKLDRPALARTGALAFRLGDPPRIDSVAGRVARHPWAQ